MEGYFMIERLRYLALRAESKVGTLIYQTRRKYGKHCKHALPIIAILLTITFIGSAAVYVENSQPEEKELDTTPVALISWDEILRLEQEEIIDTTRPLALVVDVEEPEEANIEFIFYFEEPEEVFEFFYEEVEDWSVTNPTSLFVGSRFTVSEEILFSMICVVWAEARGEGFLGMLLVAQCLLDRAETSGWSIERVINQPRAFAIGSPERVLACGTYNEVRRAVEAALDGQRAVPTHYVIHFRSNAVNTDDWHSPWIGRIGVHDFYGWLRSGVVLDILDESVSYENYEDFDLSDELEYEDVYASLSDDEFDEDFVEDSWSYPGYDTIEDIDEIIFEDEDTDEIISEDEE
jgi:hypothetical protein